MSVFSDLKRNSSLNEKPKRIEKATFSDIPLYMWTRPSLAFWAFWIRFATTARLISSVDSMMPFAKQQITIKKSNNAHSFVCVGWLTYIIRKKPSQTGAEAFFPFFLVRYPHNSQSPFLSSAAGSTSRLNSGGACCARQYSLIFTGL